MTEGLLLGIDLGAGSLKSILIDADGAFVASASAEVRTFNPSPGFSEQDPQDWWAALKTSLGALWDKGIDPSTIRAISVTAGAHSHVLEDADGRIIRRAIMWNDQRSGPQAERLRSDRGQQILRLSGNRVSPTWTLPQLLWLQENEPDAHARIARIYPAKDWLRGRLDGSWATDLTDAWGVMFADATTGDEDPAAWSDALCAMAAIGSAQLPPIVDSVGVTGSVSAQAAAETGLAPGTPVVCGTSDTNAETYCAGMTKPGTGVLKVATAGTVSTLTPAPRFSEDVIHYPHLVPQHFYAILGTNSCASAHRWLRDTFFLKDGFDAMDAAAAEVPAGSHGLQFHPYLNGERSPYWDPDLRASFTGMSFEHAPGHFCRALYEGIAYSLRDCLEVLKGRDRGFGTARLVGGGARSPVWAQIIADVTGVEIEIPAHGDASFGAALIAGIGCGAFSDTDDAASVIRVAGRYTPQDDARTVYERGFSLFRDTKTALTPINHRIVALQRGGAG